MATNSEDPSGDESLAALDDRLVAALQGGLPRELRPFAELARRLGVEESVVLGRLREMKRDGRLRRLGAVANQRRLGLDGNCLVAWNVPDERTDEVGRRLTTRRQVTHAYLRPRQPEWPYNLYTMVHAADEPACRALVAGWAAELKLPEYLVLPTRREWKKSPPVYFATLRSTDDAASDS